MFVQTLISGCTFPLGLCNVCWMVYVWDCRMHYGAFRRMCTAHFLPKMSVREKHELSVEKLEKCLTLKSPFTQFIYLKPARLLFD